jgi:tRNA(Arg) A34 adenosine deaminase TadA
MPVDPFTFYLDRKVSELVEVENTAITPQEAERHTIFSLLVMALADDAFNGNKLGAVGRYPWREHQKIADDRYAGDPWGDRYVGHNIVCLAIDGRGEIIDYEFNHNDLFNSSAEHAEARLVRRIFSINDGFEQWETRDKDDIVDAPYGTTLSAVTIYTSLESCAQCSGIMALGNVKRVVYLQEDPGQYRIGNILYNLSNPLGISHPRTHPTPPGERPPRKYGAPEPVSAGLFGFELKAEIEAAYRSYAASVGEEKPFFTRGARVDKSNSITSFLCTDAAKSIFHEAGVRLNSFHVEHKDYRPDVPPDTRDACTNAGVLEQAQEFRIWALKAGRRATPHR